MGSAHGLWLLFRIRLVIYRKSFTTGQTSASLLRHHHQLLRLMLISAFPD